LIQDASMQTRERFRPRKFQHKNYNLHAYDHLTTLLQQYEHK
jgi:hypothetical protein